MDQSLDDQVRVVLKILRAKQQQGVQLPRDSPTYAKVLEWVRIPQGKVDGTLRRELIEAFCTTFAVDEKEIVADIAEIAIRAPTTERKVLIDEEPLLELLLPKGGWFDHYAEYTRYNEAPMSYHIMSSLVVLGAAVGRRCFIDMGHFKVFAPVNAILIGPTGVVHKSTAVDIARDLIYDSVVCPILSDKITAESLVTNLMGHPQQFIPAGELSVFFGRQKYLEGLTTIILKLMDYPKSFSAETQARQKEEIIEPTISILGGSTMSLLTRSTPEEVLSSGFLNRFMLVSETSTKRVFPKPRKGKGEMQLLEVLKWLKSFSGEIQLNEPSPAYTLYDSWYRSRKAMIEVDHAVAEVTQRGPAHLLRLSMLIHIVQCSTLIICEACMLSAIKLLAFYERKAPELVRAIHSSTQTTQVDYVIGILERLGGAADHSTLLRRVSSKLNADQLKTIMRTLNESGQVRISTKGLGQYYVLREDAESANTGN